MHAFFAVRLSGCLTALDPVMSEANKAEATPAVIRELKNYQPFSFERSFEHSLLAARDTYKHENRAIGVFTSGDDAPGKRATEFISIILYFYIYCNISTE